MGDRSFIELRADVRKDFFFEKKKQKTFEWLSRAYPADLRQGVRVFWFFFSKKNMLPKPLSHKPP
jgi:hypothetical protein